MLLKEGCTEAVCKLWRGRLYKLKVLVFEGHNGATVAAPGLLHVQSDTGTYEL